MAFKSGLIKECINSAEPDFIFKLASCAEELMADEVWPEGVNTLLRLLGEQFSVSRVWVFQLMRLTETHITQDYIFEWAAKPEYAQIGLSRFNMFTNPLKDAEYRGLVESRVRGEWQSVSVDMLTPDFIRGDLESQGIKSMLTVPLFVDGKCWGILGYDDCERKHDWTMSEISCLRLAGTLIENLVLRKLMAAKAKQFNALNSIKESCLWSLDFKTWHIHFTSSLADVPVTEEENSECSLRSVLRLIHQEDREVLLNIFRQKSFYKEKSIRKDIRVLKADGTYKWVEIIGSVHLDAGGVPTLIAGIAVDIIDRKKIEEKLKTEATIDPLTGIMNRRAFLDRLDSFISASFRRKSPFAILMLDIDHFKKVNDRWGHNVGDAVLKHFALYTGHQLRREDVFARYGGEEFVILLPDTDRQGASVIGNRIREYIMNSVCSVGGNEMPVTISLGCTSYCGREPLEPEKILETVDSALYQAKRSGRNRLCCAALDD